MYLNVIYRAVFLLVVCASGTATAQERVPWEPTKPLLNALATSQVVVHHNLAMLVGGLAYDSVRQEQRQALPWVTVSKLESNGTPTGWTVRTMSIHFRDHAIAAHDNFVYVIGGSAGNVGTNTTSVSDKIYRFLPPDPSSIGHVSIELVGNYPYPVETHSIFATNSRLFVFGGAESGGKIHSEVYSVPFNALDPNQLATTASFRTEWSLPRPLRWGAVAYARSNIYYLGGETSSGSQTLPVDSIYRASLDSSGALTSWTWAGRLPSAQFLHTVLVEGTDLILIPGLPRSSGQTVYRAPVDAAGEIGEWVKESEIPEKVSRFAAFTLQRQGRFRRFLFGGNVSNFNNGADYRNQGYMLLRHAVRESCDSALQCAADGCVQNQCCFKTCPSSQPGCFTCSKAESNIPIDTPMNPMTDAGTDDETSKKKSGCHVTSSSPMPSVGYVLAVLAVLGLRQRKRHSTER